MQHYWSLEDVNVKNAWLTIGQFDGVHLGHQEIIRRLVEGAHIAEAPAVAITFFPHPAVILGKRENPSYLTTPQERATLLEDLGVDLVITHPFDLQVAATTAWDFVTKINQKLGFTCLMVGHDFALGKDRQGDIPTLEIIGAQLGFSIESVQPVEVDGHVVSSSLIRDELSAGHVKKAAQLLGRPYCIWGEVIPGDGRGSTIGIPTANLNFWPKRALPKAGVYVCRAQVGGINRGAVTNVGVRPTFKPDSSAIWVETHILDFNANIYNQEVQLDFVSRLRDEQRFPNIEALVNQIHQDIAQARKILGR